MRDTPDASSARPQGNRPPSAHNSPSFAVLGGVAPIPWRLPEVEQWLRGQALPAGATASAQGVALPLAGQAGARAMAHAQPLATNGHKVPMTSAAVERALLRLVR